MFYKALTKKLTSELPIWSEDFSEDESFDGWLSKLEEEATLEFREVVSKELKKYIEIYPWTNSLGAIADNGYKHIAINLDRAATRQEVINPTLSKYTASCYSFYPTSMYQGKGAYEIIYIYSTNPQASIIFPGTEEPPLNLKAGGFIIYPSTHAFAPLLLIEETKSREENKNVWAQLICTSIFVPETKLENEVRDEVHGAA